jgi:hypothetical protein
MNLSLFIMLLGYAIKVVGTSLAIRFVFPKKEEFEHIYWIWDFIIFKNISPEYIPLPIEIVRKFFIGRVITSLLLGIACGIPMLFILNTLGLVWMILKSLWEVIKSVPPFMRWLWSEKKLIYMALLFMVFL